MKKQLSYIAVAFLVSGMLTAQKIDLNAMPKAGPTPAINIAQPKTFTLKNGLTVMVVENHKLPRVNMSLTMDRPPIFEGNKSGVSSIMADQLGNGTTTLSKEEFNKKVDYLGANLDFYSGGASANTLSKYFTQVTELMADAIINPKFTTEEVEKSKERTIEGIKSSEKSASAIAQNVFSALTYGKNTARGKFETEETVKNIQLADVQEHYKKYYAPDNAYLVIVGDVNFNDVKKLITKNFSSWKKSGTVYPTLEPANNLAKTEINVVDVPTAVQSVVNVGNLTSLKMKDPKYFAATIANYILGGGAESRLFMNLREKNGFTYGAYSSLDTSKYSSDFSANANVRNEVADKAVKEFMNELNGIATIKPEELANAKAKLKGNFIMSLEKPETIARFALNQKTQNLPADFYTNYLKSIDKVTVSDVSNAAKTVILPNQTRIFVAGKGSQISKGLESLGYPVKYFDRFANPVEKSAEKAVDANTTVATIAENYLKAIGGKEALQKVNSITTLATGTVQNMPLELSMIQAKGGKNNVDVKMMGQSMQKTVFDGKNGYMMVRGQKIDLPQETKDEMAKNKELFPELTFASDSSCKLSGIEKYNGEDSYVVKQGDNTYYYSVKTGLKTGEIKTTKMMGQTMTIPFTYSDYKEVSGVKLPYKFTQSAMGQDLNFEVKSYQINQAKDEDFK